MRDIAAERGIAAVGISGDKPDRQKRFDEKCDLGYSLLSDPDHEAAEAFGVWREKKMYGNTYWGIVRSAFLVDEDGRIEHAWYKISPKNTAINLAAVLPEE
ncbi:MAG: redoxin domain-containing protein [bacterium]|nr:redoxin domain-containing protein [bacterium]